MLGASGAASAGVELGFETLVGGALSAARIGASVLKATGGAGLAAAGSAAVLASQYQMGQANAEKIQNWNDLAISNNLQIKPNDIDYALVSSVMPDLDFNSPQDREMIEHLARGAAIERGGRTDGAGSGGISGSISVSSSSSASSNKVSAAAVTTTSSDDQEFAICKVSYPYDPSQPVEREGWMKPKKLTENQRSFLDTVPLYGLNPGNVTKDKGYIEVDTELPGGDVAARACFKNLTGKDVPLIVEKYFDFRTSDGTVYVYRQLGKSGHPKVEINAGESTTSIQRHEKITFK